MPFRTYLTAPTSTARWWAARACRSGLSLFAASPLLTRHHRGVPAFLD
jgi:hypothetical protein